MNDPSPPAPRFLRVLGTFDIAAMTLVGVVALRWLPRAARAGTPSLLLWLLAWATFFVPLSATVVDLSRRFPEQGGLYAWARRAFGPRHALACGWCLWINNLFYFPSLLLFGVASALAMWGSEARTLADDPVFATVAVLALIWLCVAVNVVGYRYAKWLHNIGSAGTWLPAMLLIGMGVVAFSWYGSATTFSFAGLVPREGGLATLNLWSAVCFAFSGLELGALSGQEVRDPARVIPRGVWIAGMAATIIYMAGSAAILVAVPPSALTERTGIVDAIALMAAAIGIVNPGAVIGGLLALAAVAMTSAWFAGASRVLFVAGLDRLMPPAFGSLHPRFGTPHVVLILQGIGTSILLVVSVLMTRLSGATSVQEAYDVLVNLTILVYFVPYLYLFLARPVLDRQESAAAGTSAWRRARVWGMSILGLSATLASLVLALVPPPGTRTGFGYELSLLGQAGTIIAVGFVLSWVANRRPTAPGDR